MNEIDFSAVSHTPNAGGGSFPFLFILLGLAVVGGLAYALNAHAAANDNQKKY